MFLDYTFYNVFYSFCILMIEMLIKSTVFSLDVSGMNANKPVSYTHLDVYKRQIKQEQGCVNFIADLQRLMKSMDWNVAMTSP